MYCYTRITNRIVSPPRSRYAALPIWLDWTELNWLHVCEWVSEQARTQTFENGGCEFKGFYKGGGVRILRNSDFETKNRGVNSVSCEKLHDLEIICPARGVRMHHRHPPPPPPPAYGVVSKWVWVDWLTVIDWLRCCLRTQITILWSCRTIRIG